MAKDDIIHLRLEKKTIDRIQEVSGMLQLSKQAIIRLVLDGNLDIWQDKPEIKPPGKGGRP